MRSTRKIIMLANHKKVTRDGHFGVGGDDTRANHLDIA